nr:3'-5' exonuclease [uncultured Blautia sp.]
MEWRNIASSKEDFMNKFCGAKSIIVFDTETTGLGKDAKIIEFAAVRYEITESGLKETHKMDLFINPQETLSEKIIQLTGITDRIVEKANTEEIEAPGIFSFMNSADIWAAYNCSFDLRMMDQMSSRTGIPYRQRPCLDVLKMARDFVKKEDVENHKLQTVLQVMFPEKTFRFHQAIDDVRATALIMSKFIKQYLDYEESSCQDRHSCRLVYAYYCINPNQKSQVRIKLNLSEGEYGDIYWDVINKVWSCKKTSKAKRLFESVNIANLEKQVLSRYGWRYQAQDMESLAANWGKAKKEYMKQASNT